MNEIHHGGNPLSKIHELGLGPGIVLAEQRREAGEASPGSRFGLLGSMVKRIVRRLLRFHSLRQSEFNTGIARAVREAEGHLRLLAAEADRLRELTVKLDQDHERRVGVAFEVLDAHAKRVESLRDAIDERRLHEQQMEGRIHELQGSLREIDGVSRRLGQKLGEGEQSRAAEVQRQTQRLDEQRLWLEGRLAELETTVAQIGPIAEESDRRTAQLDASVAAQRLELDEQSRRLADQERQNEGFRGSLGEVRGSLGQMESLRASIEQISALRESVTQLETLREELSRLQANASGWADESRGRTETQAQRVESLDHEFEQAMELLRGSLASQTGRLDHLNTRIDELLGRLSPLEKVERIEQDTLALGHQLPALATELRDRVSALAERVDPVLPLDYVSFERHFRGDEALIQDRMRGYTKIFGNVRRVLDVGCGRGEFLTLCREQGIGAYGVDADPDMVSSCRLKGLEVIHDDLLHHLESLEDRSLDGIFSAQVIEHLTPADLIRFLQLASIKLRRGAMLVLETINTDTFTALRTYFMDMTHRRPIPSRLLHFLVEAAGFSIHQVIFSSPIPDDGKLQPLPAEQPNGKVSRAMSEIIEVHNRNCAILNHLLFAEQDYAIVAQR